MPARFTKFSVVRFLISSIEKIFSRFQSLSLRLLILRNDEEQRDVMSSCMNIARLCHMCVALMWVHECRDICGCEYSRMWCYHAKKVVIDSRAFTWPLVCSWRETWTCDSFEHVMLRRTCNASIDRFKCILWWTIGFSRVVWKFFNQC